MAFSPGVSFGGPAEKSCQPLQCGYFSGVKVGVGTNMKCIPVSQRWCEMHHMAMCLLISPTMPSSPIPGIRVMTYVCAPIANYGAVLLTADNKPTVKPRIFF